MTRAYRDTIPPGDMTRIPEELGIVSPNRRAMSLHGIVSQSFGLV
jgi:hypothetical protein